MKNRVRFISTLTAMIVCMSLLLAGVASGSAPDVADHWAKAQVSQWMDMGLVRGYEDGSFKPDNNITRAEFFTLVNQAFGYTDKADTAFADVAPTAWYAEQVARAVKVGYVAGYGDGTIKPESPISRQEAAVVLARILNLDTDAGAKSLSFADAANIPAWSRGAVGAAAAAGYIRGYEDDTFRPTNSITRAESVVMLSRAVGELVNTAGVFGSADERTVVAGNLTVSVADVTLRNVEVQGNLYITEGVGDGDVTLDNVTVAGRTLIKGGGPNSIIIRDSNLGETVIDKSDGDVRIVALGDSRIALVIVNSGARLEEGAGLTGDGFGDVTIIELPPDAVIEFSGHFSNVTVDAPANVVIAGGSVGNLTVGDGAEGSSIDIGQGARVENLTANAGASVTGSGSVGKATINANGVTMDQTPRELDVADGVDDVSVGTGSPPVVVPPDDSPGHVAMTITTNLPTFRPGKPETFTIGTVANDDAGKMVRAHFTLPDGVTIEYQEGGAGPWIPLADVFGPAAGFPLGNITTTFRGTFDQPGTYNVTVEFRQVSDGTVLGSRVITATVAAQPMEITATVPQFKVGEPATFQIGTVAHDDVGKMVRAHFTLPEDVTIEYQEGGAGPWLPLTDVFGPAAGFPLGDITTQFRGTFAKAGTYNVTVEFRQVSDGTVLASKVVTAEVVQPMEITANLPEFKVGEPATFTIGTVAHDDAGKMVRAHFTLPDDVTIEYQEGGQGHWIPLTDVFGPAAGFPLGDITTQFRGTFAKAGTYNVTVEFRLVSDGTVLGRKVITATVNP